MIIIKQFETGCMENFCYIVGCEDSRQAMVIDPGADVERILSIADKEDLKIVNIVNTHGHGDHTAGNASLKALTEAEIIIHMLDGTAGRHHRLAGPQLWPCAVIDHSLGKTKQRQRQGIWLRGK